jgi:hypothetical protein
VRSGRQDFVVYENVRDFFGPLVQGLETGIDSIRRENIAAVLSNEEFVRSLWGTIVSRGIQYRMTSKTHSPEIIPSTSQALLWASRTAQASH